MLDSQLGGGKGLDKSLRKHSSWIEEGRGGINTGRVGTRRILRGVSLPATIAVLGLSSEKG